MIWIELDELGLIFADRIVVIGQSETAPMRRLLAAMPPDKIITLTGGQRRQTVALLDSGHAVIMALSTAEIMVKLKGLGKDGSHNFSRFK